MTLAPPRATHVHAARTPDELRERIPSWEGLALNALEPNVWYEPFLLVPAIEELGRQEAVVTLFISGPGGELIGVFPLQRLLGSFAVPAPHYSMWKHPYCYLCTPLLRPGAEMLALGAVFGWLTTHGRETPLQFRLHPADGPFDRVLRRFLLQTGRRMHTTLCYDRGAIATSLPYDDYVQANVAAKKRKQSRRLWRRLGERGRVRVERARTEDEVDGAVEQFLALEHSGWKGQRGTSFASNQRDQAFLRVAMRAGAVDGRVEIWSLTLDDAPIAMAIVLRALAVVYTFKIAYDEAFALYSPGVQLDLAMVAGLLAEPGVELIDSCADPGYALHDSHWGERRAIRVGTVVRGSIVGRAVGQAGVQGEAASRGLRACLAESSPEVQGALRRVRRVLAR